MWLVSLVQAYRLSVKVKSDHSALGRYRRHSLHAYCLACVFPY